MTATTYRKKSAALKKYAQNYIKRASSHYHKLLKRDSNPTPTRHDTNDLIEMHVDDLSKVLKVCYWIRMGEYADAYKVYYNMDSEPQDHFPSTLIKLLAELADFDEETEKSGYRKV